MAFLCFYKLMENMSKLNNSVARNISCIFSFECVDISNYNY